MKPKYIRIIKTFDPLNWWNDKDIIGKTFEVLDISPYKFVKIEYEEGYFGWVPLTMCEINPHLKLVRCR